MAWLNGWQYRKKITISGSTGAGTNYQVPLKVGESSGAIGADFHVNGHSANFPSGVNQGGDLRFTADDETTLLSFWVEQVTGTSPNRVALVWVKVSADLGTDKYIYCYYGNSNATNASSVENTFIREIDGNQPVKGAWSLDEGSGTIAYDKSGNNNNGTLVNGPTWVDGKFGKALSFDGVNDYVNCGSGESLDLTRWTIVFWAKVRTNKNYNGFIIKGLDGAENYEVLGFSNGSFHLPIRYTDGTRDYPNTPANIIIPGEWAHYAYTYDPAQGRRFYKNGSLVFQDTQSKTPMVTTEPLFIGNEKGTSRYLDGIIDELCIYNRALTAAEISDLYNYYGYTTTNYPGRVLVRKYVSPEPAFSLAEEEETSGVTYYKTLEATEVAVCSLLKVASFFRSLVVTEISIPVLIVNKIVEIIKHIKLSKYIKGLELSKYFKSK